MNNVPSGAAPSKISVVTPVEWAWSTMRALLFRPFDIARWMTMGFCAWLAVLTDGGASFPNLNFNWKSGDTGDLMGAWGESILPWLQNNRHLLLVVLLPLVFLALFISLLLTWISSRGRFMFLDNVVTARAEVVAPWRRHRRSGNSYFLFSIALGVLSLAVLALLIGIFAMVALPDIGRRTFGVYAVLALAGGGMTLTVFLLALGAIMVFLHDFVAPIMFAHSFGVMAAWRVFFELFKLRPGMFVLYLLFRALLQTAIGLLALLVTCITCCAAALPYIGTVILLPVYVFMRAYSLHFLGQFGDQFRLLDNMSNAAPSMD